MRGYSDCCHYDEGYDDGFEDGKRDVATAGDTADALRLLARDRAMCGQHEAALLIEQFADEVAQEPFFEQRVRHEVKRREQQAALYAEARASA